MTPPSPTLEQLELLRRLAWQEAKRAQRSANQLTKLTAYLDLLVHELRSAAAAKEGDA